MLWMTYIESNIVTNEKIMDINMIQISQTLHRYFRRCARHIFSLLDQSQERREKKVVMENDEKYLKGTFFYSVWIFTKISDTDGITFFSCWSTLSGKWNWEPWFFPRTRCRETGTKNLEHPLAVFHCGLGDFNLRVRAVESGCYDYHWFF